MHSSCHHWIVVIPCIKGSAKRPSPAHSKYSCQTFKPILRVTPILATLRWLHLRYRTDFKCVLITLKTLHGLTLTFIVGLLAPYDTSQCLYSPRRTLLTVTTTSLITKGNQVFYLRALQLWNSAPQEPMSANSVPSFKSLLKTFARKLYKLYC